MTSRLFASLTALITASSVWLLKAPSSFFCTSKGSEISSYLGEGSVTLKIVILTLFYLYELIITHTSSFASLTYQFLMSRLENQRKVPKNLLNFGVALSLYLTCSPTPNFHVLCVPKRTFSVL